MQTSAPELVGGAVCLDIANSVDGRVLAVPEDHLRSYADLVDRVALSGALTGDEAGALLTRAAAAPDAAAEELGRARDLRESVFAVFYGNATTGVPDVDHLAAVQEAYADALRHGRLQPTGEGVRWTWGLDLRLPRWLVARSAVDLVTSGLLGRVKACASQDGCQYLFIDTSKNGSRRWCSMTDCGAQAKSRRLTERRRASRSAEAPPR